MTIGAVDDTGLTYGSIMRIATWNMRRATPESGAWAYFTSPKVNPDIALLQEVSGGVMPKAVGDEWAAVSSAPVKKNGESQGFRTMILVRKTLGPIGLEDEREIRHSQPWIDNLLAHFKGNLLFRRIHVPSVGVLNLVSIYSPAWSIDSTGRKIGDTEGVKLTQNEWLWVTDILRSGLMEMMESDPSQRWVVGGDLNLSITFDKWRKKGRGNAEYLDRIANLGFIETLASTQGFTPTFKNTRGNRVVHQMDHLFVSRDFAEGLRDAWVGAADIVFGGSLSDHLPVIAELRAEQSPL